MGLVDGAEGATKSVVIGSGVVSLLLQGSLSMLWGMINACQIIAHLPYFNLMMPANAALFFNFVIELSEFDIIETDFIFEYLGLSSGEE